MDVLHLTDRALCLATLLLPIWTVWRLPRWYLYMPIGTAIFWGMSVTNGYLLLNLDVQYDSIAPGIAVLLGAPAGMVYCLLWAGIRESLALLAKVARVERSSARMSPAGDMVGLVVWTGLSGLCVVLPFWGTPRSLHKDPQLFAAYSVACSPILLLAVTLSLQYVVRLGRRRPQAPPNLRETLPSSDGGDT
jgi:hypothetical protein